MKYRFSPSVYVVVCVFVLVHLKVDHGVVSDSDAVGARFSPPRGVPSVPPIARCLVVRTRPPRDGTKCVGDERVLLFQKSVADATHHDRHFPAIIKTS